jgi:hypothetical protein
MGMNQVESQGQNFASGNNLNERGRCKSKRREWLRQMKKVGNNQKLKKDFHLQGEQ